MLESELQLQPSKFICSSDLFRLSNSLRNICENTMLIQSIVHMLEPIDELLVNLLGI